MVDTHGRLVTKHVVGYQGSLDKKVLSIELARL